MKLRAKIKSKYLDDILDGVKRNEFRQFESITLTDENGRCVEVEINLIEWLGNKQARRIIADHPDVDWDDGKPVYRIELGEQL